MLRLNFYSQYVSFLVIIIQATVAEFDNKKHLVLTSLEALCCVRVGSHVVFVSIHCTEKCPTSYHNNVLSHSK